MEDNCYGRANSLSKAKFFSIRVTPSPKLIHRCLPTQLSMSKKKTGRFSAMASGVFSEDIIGDRAKATELE